jgi:hypothetical protein
VIGPNITIRSINSGWRAARRPAVALFNQRDWDALRAMLADDVRLAQSTYPLRAGAADVGMFNSLKTALDLLRTFCAPIEDRTRLNNGRHAVNQGRHIYLLATCQCGEIRFDLVGPPIVTCSCYCTSCQEAGHQFEQPASAPPVLDPDSGTGLILYRKDRVQCIVGQQ